MIFNTDLQWKWFNLTYGQVCSECVPFKPINGKSWRTLGLRNRWHYTWR